MYNAWCLAKMYSLIKWCLQVFICGVSVICVAQDSTRVLDEVKIVGIDLSRFSSGTVVQSIKKIDGGSLTNIGDQTSIYFKNYGSQQLSTISLRGTSSSHTNVIWNGIPVNSPTLGQTDFSVWPMFLTDQLLIQKGGGSSLFGSGAIGGTVILDNSSVQKDSLISTYLGFGSFGQRNAGFKYHSNYKKIIHELLLFGSELDNNFRLEDGSKQEHASVSRLGISNKLYFDYEAGRLFSEIAYAENDRDIQPTRTSASRSTLQSKNLRAVLNNEISGKLVHHSTIGFIKDQTIFNDSSITKSFRLLATHAIEKSVGSSVFLRFGGTGIHEWAASDNFEKREKQTQGHLFASGTFFIRHGIVTLNLRQALYKNDKVFIPSLGFESNSIGIGEYNLILRSQVSRDFRVPTFNDLFWRPGGNPNLNAERSLNYEFGTDMSFHGVGVSITGFMSGITNWIQWTPTDGIWSPENIREVRTRGLEFSSNADIPLKSSSLQIVSEYSYVLSSDRGLAAPNQLPYVPKHSATISATLVTKQSSIGLTGNFTGTRYTTLSNSRAGRIDEFLLLDLRLEHRIPLSFALFELGMSIQNLADVNYENLINTAMPGRAFTIELTTKF